MSKEKTPVLAGVVPTFEVTMTALQCLGKQNPPLKRYTDVAVEYFKKYYSRVDNTPAYVIVMCSFLLFALSYSHSYIFPVLNPNVRLQWVEANWEQNYINTAINHVKDAVCRSPIDCALSHILLDEYNPHSSMSECTSHTCPTTHFYQYGGLGTPSATVFFTGYDASSSNSGLSNSG